MDTTRTGITELDEMTCGGFHAGDVTLLCGSPLESLTDIVLTIAEHAAVDGGKNVTIRSPYEGDTHERMLTLASGLTPNGTTLNLADEHDREHLYESAKKLADAHVTLEELGADYTDDGTTPTRRETDLAVIISDTENSVREEMAAVGSNQEIPMVVVITSKSSALASKSTVVLETIERSSVDDPVEFQVSKNDYGRIGKLSLTWVMKSGRLMGWLR